ncbi:nudix hydrolase 12, mitochondrial [Ricinus communis]|uniref:Diphosphoinositol polyphosphate phosphohydrolase, putative n=1 Tax=Ricinus communis TaxID=3988 RepID=B9RGV1_RICCO|nr:nudix hydrolase 12, mitochondrial [Ricinus communis]EEF49313.1 diphosphoinositol polyphosphate phosphohydrolase, putative [Ricinus communis]|eukprot:XP_002512810.1 nudix hydrolase 12, mitochondrial [Ricinus communis]
MSSLQARTGRHRQRYEDNVRLVSGCIPYRLRKDIEGLSNDTEHRIEVLMVSSPNRTDMVFPKGGWENDETVLEAASREAIEEAGVRGILREVPLGVWYFRSKSKQDLCSLEGGCKGFMFALEVTEELETWPERENRDRKWLNIKDAFEFCRYEWMREALEKFLRVMEEDNKPEIMEEIVEIGSLPVSEVVADCQILTSNCCIKPVKRQHKGMNGMISLSWKFAFKGLPLT